MKQLIKFYRLLNILSIDVALGAVCCAAWFASLFSVHLRPYALLSLGITVWIIYTIDHLLDAKKVAGFASTERHRFHQKHFKLLLVGVLVMILVDLFFVFFIRKVVFQSGVVLAGVMVVYFLMQRYLRYVKEFIVAILFSCGVLLPSWSISSEGPDVDLVLVIGQFMTTALINLLLFSWCDRKNDTLDKRESFVTLVGGNAKMFLWTLFVFNGALMVYSILYFTYMMDSVAIIFLMNVILLLIFLQPKRFEINDRFRLLGDSIFLLPFFYLLS
jgi:hypothetical protein